jgi:general nucleoside transport system ATP-binding protein
VGQADPAEATQQSLATLMVGRDVSFTIDKTAATPGEVVLRADDLSVDDDRGVTTVSGFDLEVRAGEIFGIAGVAGNGQEELVEALTGLRSPSAGQVSIGVKDVTRHGPRALQQAGMSFVPGDRHRFGLVLSFPLEDNLILTQYDEAPYSRGMVRNDAAIHAWAKQAIAEYDIRTPSATVTAGTLSGGNQQKAVVAREFSRKLTTLILDQPTRGLDVGSIEFIHRQVIAKRDAGAAILLVSAELDEVLELSDRVAVMYRGEIVAVVDGPTAGREDVGLLMATGRRGAAAEAALAAVTHGTSAGVDA